MRSTLRQLTIGLAFGGPLLGILACREEGITTPSNETASPVTDAEMAATAAGASRIAFVVFRAVGKNETRDIYTMIPDGTGVRQLTHGLFFEDHMDWAPGNAKLVAQAGKDIYAVNADGSVTRNLTNTPNAVESDGVWSPDGRKIVYSRGSDIWVMSSSGSGQRNLTRSAAFEGEPGWSPDGKKIVYISSRLGNSAVHIMNADGSGQKNLTDGSSNWESGPVWSPDGRQIVFTAFRGGSTNVYVVNSDGSGLRTPAIIRQAMEILSGRQIAAKSCSVPTAKAIRTFT